MSSDPWFEPQSTRRRPDKPRFQLRFGAFFWRVALATFLLLEVVFWLKAIRPRIPFRPRFRRIVAMIYFTPGLAVRSLIAAFVVTLITELVFRAVVRPMMVAWYYPRSRDLHRCHSLHFRLESGETIQHEVTSRLAAGAGTIKGLLVVTNQRVYFEPYAWDAEAWFLRREQIVRVDAIMPRRRVLGLVSGYPRHVRVTDTDGADTTLIVGDPESVLGWLQPVPTPPGQVRPVVSV